MRQFRVPTKQKSSPSTNTPSQIALCANSASPQNKSPVLPQTHPSQTALCASLASPLNTHPVSFLHHTPHNIHIAQPIPLCYTKTSQNHQNNLKEELEMDERLEDLRSAKNPKARIKILKGHFATSHSHINTYIDMSTVKSRHNNASCKDQLTGNLIIRHTHSDRFQTTGCS